MDVAEACPRECPPLLRLHRPEQSPTTLSFVECWIRNLNRWGERIWRELNRRLTAFVEAE